MNAKSLIGRLTQQEDINFLLSNRIPRRLVTRFMGWWSRLEHPWVCRGSIALWRLFSDLDLSEAKTTQFKSLHDCFTRELKDGARPIDMSAAHLISPCDGLVGACGPIARGTVLQAKGFPYSLSELMLDAGLAERYEGGHYATLRLIRCRLASGALLTLVPVAAILVASIRLRFLDVLLHLRYRGPNVIPCDAPLQRGEEMGWFEHGSTIIVLAPPGIRLAEGVIEGARVQMGRPLLQIG
jgi:phosphatidylserine decarboxylase